MIITDNWIQFVKMFSNKQLSSKEFGHRVIVIIQICLVSNAKKTPRESKKSFGDKTLKTVNDSKNVINVWIW